MSKSSNWESTIKPIVVLSVISLIASLLLALVNGMTAPVIAENTKRTTLAAPEVAAANHDTDLYAEVVCFLHAAADRVHGGFVKTHALFAAQCFAADFQKDTLIFQCHNPNTTCFYLPSGHRHTLAFFTIAYFTIKHP